MADITLKCRVNGKDVSLVVPPFRRLLDVIRQELALTGSKEGCGEGECGACSVLLNGQVVNSCIIPAIQAQGAEIETVESMETTPLGVAVQRAFERHGGSQCGMCTPGMIVTAVWLARTPGPGGATLRENMAGNLCRCTGYDQIIASIRDALKETGHRP